MGEAEAQDIRQTGGFRSAGTTSIEGKYFTTSRLAAEQYAALAREKFGHLDGNYSLVKAVVPNSLLTGYSSFNVSDVRGGLPSYIIGEEDLPGMVPLWLAEEEER